ncbi:hypothetical protein G6F46_013897 [Rhizopus delemar]|nr:hypothetical protein G6F46_013897 [Rhizopus delemar]
MCLTCRGTRSRALKSPGSATAIAPKAASRRRTRAATRCTGSARLVASRTPALAPTSMRCAPGISRSPRSRSTCPATRRWRRWPAGSAASVPRWTGRHESTPAIAAGSCRHRHDLAARA